MKYDAIKISVGDNVATALRDLEPLEKCRLSFENDDTEIEVLEQILLGHKFAVKDILKGEDIIKYGEVIGRATAAINKGAHAHIQNIESLRGRGDLLKKGK